MGIKRVSIRTLPSGERVRHYPPCDKYPEGRMELIRDTSPLRERILARIDERKSRQAQRADRHADRVALKKERQQAKGLPSDKSPI